MHKNDNFKFKKLVHYIALLLTVVEKGVKGQRKATKARNSEYNGESFVLKES
jgi:hypothetical protein